ncbi:hypothetical protein [Natrialba sp. INN-245]|uniref:hypothetical protein n=1 Tax=Natrialba sp. INN-245 TaxID=2690967 RepID=UPI001310E953|nr:hypothetical protein [Natrialba sp. INN-245]MWV39233.1 hypothetical protein [Natrialba sp. INN-245]
MTALTPHIPAFARVNSGAKALAAPAEGTGAAWGGFGAVVGYPMSIIGNIGSVRAA